MRRVTIAHADGPDAAAVVGDSVIELPADLACLGVVGILADDAALAAARAKTEWAVADAVAAARSTRLDDVELLAPVVPGKILCLEYNYRGHVPDGVDPTADDSQWPDVFVKTPNTLRGPRDPVEIPPGATDADYEVEVVRDGVVTVSQRTSTTIFSVAFIIHHLSQVLTPEPGDVVSTGTPQELPEAVKSHRPLAGDDVVSVRISRIGELTTRFTDHTEASS